MNQLFDVNADILRAIGYMCPRLDRFIFYEQTMHPKTHPRNVYLWNEYDSSIHLVAPEELKSILSAWPKVKPINFHIIFAITSFYFLYLSWIESL